MGSSANSDKEGVQVTIAEAISAKLSREGAIESFEVKGDLQLRISDPSLTQVKLNLNVDALQHLLSSCTSRHYTIPAQALIHIIM